MNKRATANTFFLVISFSPYLISAILLLLFILDNILNTSFTTLLYEDFFVQTVVSQISMFLIPSLIFFAIIKCDLKEVFPIKPFDDKSIKNIVLITLISLLLIPIGSLIGYISSFFADNVLGEMIEQSLANTSYFKLFIAIGIIPAILEELVFRGFIFNLYRQSSKLSTAIIISSIFFGLMHGNLYQLVYPIVFGAVFAYLVYKTSSIFSSILAHFVINGSQVLVLYLTRNLENDSSANIEFNYSHYISLAIFFIIIFTLLTMLFKAFNELNEGNELDDINDIRRKRQELAEEVSENEESNNYFDIQKSYNSQAEYIYVEPEEEWSLNNIIPIIIVLIIYLLNIIFSNLANVS